MTLVKRKILFVLHSLGGGGAQHQLITLLSGLDKDRFQVSLAYLEGTETLLHKVNQLELEAVFCCNVSKRLDLRAIQQLKRFIHYQNIEIIICLDQYPMLYGYLSNTLVQSKCCLIEVLHNTILPSYYEELKSALVYKWVFRKCNKVIFVCKNQQEHWINKIGSHGLNYIHIYNGVDVAHFTDRISEMEKKSLRDRLCFLENDYVVGICGLLRKEKKHTELLEAASLLKQQGIKIKILIIGDGELRTSLENFAKERSLTKDVVITGYQEDVRPFISICDCMALTSHAVETFSLSILESMAMEKPVINTNIGGASEQIDHGVNGFLYEKGKIAALTHYLQCLTDKNLRVKMGQASRRIVEEHFTKDKMISRYQEVFLSI
jgi:glycosyltransferase involved in cell wall biosynthesis